MPPKAGPLTGCPFAPPSERAKGEKEKKVKKTGAGRLSPTYLATGKVAGLPCGRFRLAHPVRGTTGLRSVVHHGRRRATRTGLSNPLGIVRGEGRSHFLSTMTRLRDPASIFEVGPLGRGARLGGHGVRPVQEAYILLREHMGRRFEIFVVGRLRNGQLVHRERGRRVLELRPSLAIRPGDLHQGSGKEGKKERGRDGV